MRQLLGQKHLVAHRAELGRAVQRFEERPLVQLGLGFNQAAIDRPENRIVAVLERILWRPGDGVGSVAPHAVNVRDGMADRTGDSGMGGGLFLGIEVRIVELSGQQRHRVVARGAKAAGVDVAVPLQQFLPRIVHREGVGRIVERAEVMGAMEPLVVGVLVALHAELVVLKPRSVGVLAPGDAGQGRGEHFLAGFGQGRVGLFGFVPVHAHHRQHEHGHRAHPGQSPPPLKRRTGQAVQHVGPNRSQRSYHVHPVQGVPIGRIALIGKSQQKSRCQNRHRKHQQQIADPHRMAIGPPPGRPQVYGQKHHKRQREDDSQQNMQQHHEQEEGVLQRDGCAAELLHPFQKCDRGQIDGVGPQQGQQHEHHGEQPGQARTHGRKTPGSRRLIGHDGNRILRRATGCPSNRTRQGAGNAPSARRFGTPLPPSFCASISLGAGLPVVFPAFGQGSSRVLRRETLPALAFSFPGLSRHTRNRIDVTHSSCAPYAN